jgi:hypothetical protein
LHVDTVAKSSLFGPGVTDEKRFQAADDLRKQIRHRKVFPDYVKIGDPDALAERVVHEPSLFGIVGTKNGPPMDRVRLTDLTMDTILHPPMRSVWTFMSGRDDHVNEGMIIGRLGLPQLPSRDWAYYAKNSDDAQQIQQAVSTTDDLIQGLERVALMELIHVM